ncbi:MAG: hypothetical protein PHW32_00510 [Bacilli bacterium]|nr:hypothetical protein [Bacilli bacterium]MDD4282225.1 hypothetical protein [Bacilli bacterium]MDD4718224.1 hypothetical protein [Bacilli bacterium]
MNSYLLHFVGKLISLLVVSITSVFGAYQINNIETVNTNDNVNKSLNIVHTVIEYDTLIKRTSRLPLNTKKIIVQGVDGLVYEDKENKTVDVIKEVVHEVVELGTGPSGKHHGRLTAYGADCNGCSGTTACRLPTKKYHNLYKDGIVYNDTDYGEIRILAASHKVFPCGTIIKVTRESDEPFIGIVMDTGIAMRNAWDNEERIIVDLAFLEEADPQVRKTTSNNVKYNVLRWGW